VIGDQPDTAAEINVNWVYGFGQTPQKIMPEAPFVVLLMPLFPLIIYLDAPSFRQDLSRSMGVGG
jgi:hypothetical protein